MVRIVNDGGFSLVAEQAHKNCSALKRPRKASVFMAMAERPELEALGMSPGEIGATRRTGAFCAQ